MIHYHGTPCGGQRVEAARFLAGRHALIPFPRPDDLALALNVCRSFVVDNGAFTIWRQGGVLDYSAYVEWVASFYRHPAFDWAIIPDVIDGDEQENDLMVELWPREIPGVPVFHLHESLSRAERLAKEWPVVALGSSGDWPTPGNASWRARMAEVMNVITDADGRPFCKLHGLRMMAPPIFTKYPFRSVDSTNCAQNGSRNAKRIDERLTSGQGAIITAWRIESHSSPGFWDRKAASPMSDQTLFGSCWPE
jgi:hypothetical protein